MLLAAVCFLPWQVHAQDSAKPAASPVALETVTVDGVNRLDVNVRAHSLLDREDVTTAITELPQADRAVISENRAASA